MKDFLEKIKSNNKDGEEVSTQKTIVFFAFYVVFFIVVFCVIFLGGKKDYLKQEYEPGNNVYEPGIGNTNFVFDYKVTLNGVLHDYYGKRYGNVEAFKYNNFDYYFDGEQFLVNKDTWIITYMNEKELDNGDVELYYLVSSNTINQDLYGNNTDYDEEPDSITVLVGDNNIKKITYKLDHFCSHRDNCKSLMIEMNFEMYGSVSEIDNPIG